MKAKKLLKVGLMLAATALVAGCKIEVVAVQGGDIAWEGGSCPEGSNCVIEITDPNYSNSFTATPKPGYKFTAWRAGSNFLCGQDSVKFKKTCTVNFGLFETKIANAFIAVYETHYLTPIYVDVGLDPDKDGLRNEKDLDDDGDGIYDVDDNCELTPLLVAVDTDGCPIP